MDAVTRSPEHSSTARPGWPALLRASLGEHRHYLAYCAYYLLVGWTILVLSVPGAAVLLARNIGDLTLSFFTPLVATLALWFSIQALKLRSLSPRRLAAEAARAEFLQPERVARLLPALVSLPFVLATFLTIKLQIGRLHPFDYDAPIIRLSGYLTGGRPVWLYFAGLFDHPWTIVALNGIYYLWFPVLCSTFVWRLFSFRKPHLRLQLLLTVVACWGLAGSFAALAFPSAGPAFLPHLWTGPTPFDGLLHHLRALEASGHDLTALKVQHVLWYIHASQGDTMGGGISAMPSLHVAMASILAIYGWRLGWLAGLAYTAFALAIFLGSIVLAFHYALDGLAGAAIAAAIWAVSGRLADLVHPREASAPRPLIAPARLAGIGSPV